MQIDFYKVPRLYVDYSLRDQGIIELNKDQAHYLKNVLRKDVGAHLRIFNGRDGEFLADITEIKKKICRVEIREKLKEQPEQLNSVHLYFAPMKKTRLDFLIEKSVELGVGGFHPVITSRTETRKLNIERINKQIIEASEQCERLDIPAFHDFIRLHELPDEQKILWCAERQNAQRLSKVMAQSWSFLIGPEGGFDEQEIQFLQQKENVMPVSLGSRILRAETAALVCLVYSLI